MPFHPSTLLNFYFGRRPYQGADPSNAQNIFIGEDANFAPDVEEQATIWSYVEEYLNDGVAFWNRHGVQDQTKRAVSENSKTLGFNLQEWE